MSFLKICIIVDHPRRDLYGKIILLNQILKKNKNLKIFIVSSFNLHECLLIDPDLIILNHCRPSYANFINICYSRGKIICVADQEGAPFGVKGGLEGYSNNIANVIDKIDKFFVWGKYQYDFIKKKLINLKENIFIEKLCVTGTTNFDFLGENFLPALKIVKKKKKIILINSNFPTCNPRFQKNLKKEILNWESDNLISIIDANKHLIKQKNIQKKFIILIKKLLERFNNYKFILNPHPFEDFRYYKKFFQSYNNIIIIKDHFLPDLILNADYCISYKCQTSIETLLAKKISLSPSFIDKKNNFFFKDSYYHCKSFKDLIRIISTNVKLKKNKTTLKKIFLAYNNFFDKSYILQSNAIISEIKKNRRISNFTFLDHFNFVIKNTFLLKDFKGILRFLVFLLIGIKNMNILKFKFGFGNKEKFIKLQTLFDIQNRLSKSLEFKTNHLIYKSTNSSFLSFFYRKIMSYEVYQK